MPSLATKYANDYAQEQARLASRPAIVPPPPIKVGNLTGSVTTQGMLMLDQPTVLSQEDAIALAQWINATFK